MTHMIIHNPRYNAIFTPSYSFVNHPIVLVVPFVYHHVPGFSLHQIQVLIHFLPFSLS
jgi:hypothetical protein